MAISNKIERYYPVPIELANSLAFRSLSNRAKVLWHDLMMQYNGNNNGNINATLGGLKHYGWRSLKWSPATVQPESRIKL